MNTVRDTDLYTNKFKHNILPTKKEPLRGTIREKKLQFSPGLRMNFLQGLNLLELSLQGGVQLVH
jgi:hypothetical protein